MQFGPSAESLPAGCAEKQTVECEHHESEHPEIKQGRSQQVLRRVPDPIGLCCRQFHQSAEVPISESKSVKKCLEAKSMLSASAQRQLRVCKREVDILK
jgi:hypothetical protein